MCLWHILVEWVIENHPVTKDGCLPHFPPNHHVLIEQFIEGRTVPETQSYLQQCGTFNHKLAAVRELVGLYGNEHAPNGRKALSSNATTKIVDHRATGQTGENRWDTRSFMFVREKDAENASGLVNNGTSSILIYEHLGNPQARPVDAGLLRSFYEDTHLMQVKTVPRLYLEYCGCKKSEFQSGYSYSKKKEARSLVTQIMKSGVAMLVDKEDYSDSEVTNFVKDNHWHISVKVVQGRMDPDATFTTLPHTICHHSLSKNDTTRKAFFAKVPLHPSGLWSHYYMDAHDTKGTVAFISYGMAMIAPASVTQVVDHRTHVEGNPFLLFTIVPLERNKVDTLEKLQEMSEFIDKRLVRNYPHLRRTTDKLQREKTNAERR
ncbi:unknown protein [Seminavis robusta]|uniref:Uncharacterized protein n=1 Tax=Seminavis robusta TaxID=568900 RepID=A0A9N8ERN2_9STRA|nr:unknown protein [Seminavis robusta]|eukprot:Sro1513_g278820.1 n/a (377) ;mRNA; f:682-1937